MDKEVTVGTVVQYQQRSNEDRHQRWARLERAELSERYGALHAQGVSQRQAAEVLEVPRSTLQAWRTYQERLDECPAVVAGAAPDSLRSGYQGGSPGDRVPHGGVLRWTPGTLWL